MPGAARETLEEATNEIRGLTSQLGELVPVLKTIAEAQSEAQVVHHHHGETIWTPPLIIAICACFFTVVLVVIVAIGVAYEARSIKNEVRDLTAWKDVYGRDIAAIKQAQQQAPPAKEKSP